LTERCQKCHPLLAGEERLAGLVGHFAIENDPPCVSPDDQPIDQAEGVRIVR